MLKVNILHASVLFGREVFGEVIGNIFSSLLSVEEKLFLLDVTPHPFEAHVKCFGAFPAHISRDDSVGGFVVSFYWSWRLRMAHFNQGRADGSSLLAVAEDCTSFSLGGGCHEGADGLALGEDWAVCSGSRPDGGREWSVAPIVMARSTTEFFGMNEIRCVTINVEIHVARVKTNDGVWLCGSVVHQYFQIFYGVSDGRSLLGADFVEHDKHGGIDGT